MKLIGTMLVLIFVISSSHAGASGATPVWVVDPATPGPDVPPQGASLFDRITTDASGVQNIPYPFERLIDRIDAAAGCSHERPCTRAVLIPLGRSLQRSAATPDFFAHPRAVVAVTGQGTGRLLRDRLYLGFQARSGVMEVISYNEEAGRFEFQIVSDYGEKTSRVTHARRALCIACHQNHGPIFSQPLWLETNANPKIATALSKLHDSFHGIPAAVSTDMSQAIDDATDRSTRVLLTQRLWRDGCGEEASGDACRKAVLEAALQFELSGGRDYARSPDEPVWHAISRLDERAKVLWPAGLALGASDLVNRNPLDSNEGVDIEARFDPLVPRMPADVLAPDGQSLADELVRGAAGFISPATRGRIERALAARDRLLTVPIPCRTLSAADALVFECDDAEQGTHLAGTIAGERGALNEVQVQREPVLRHLDLERVKPGSPVVLRLHDRGRKVRLPSGRALERLEIEQGEHPSARLWISEEFGIDAALADAPTAVLSTATFAGIADRLEGRTTEADSIRVRRPDLDEDQRIEQADPLSLAFEAPCGSCHHTSQTSPPNFLSGHRQRVRASLRSCAPRMLVRLSMSQMEPARRAKSPMPPELPSLIQRPINVAERVSLASVRASVESMLQEEYGRVPTLAELMRDGYESLRPCLPKDM